MSTPAEQPNLKLPAEIRVKIYAIIASEVPYDAPLSAYDGLRLSCRLIKQEFEHELGQELEHNKRYNALLEQ